MCCSRYKRRRQCTPRLSYDSCKGANAVRLFKKFASPFLQTSCVKLYLFINRAKRQKNLGLLALFFLWYFPQNMNKELL